MGAPRMRDRLKTWSTPTPLWAKLKPKSREMRHKPTPAEDKLWQSLRGDRLGGFTFRRQHPLDRFIVDFSCPSRKLVVEVDGEIHDHTETEDQARRSHLELLGYRVIRFRNEEILRQLNVVLNRIRAILEEDRNIRESSK